MQFIIREKEFHEIQELTKIYDFEMLKCYGYQFADIIGIRDSNSHCFSNA